MKEEQKQQLIFLSQCQILIGNYYHVKVLQDVKKHFQKQPYETRGVSHYGLAINMKK
jgi:hypothetical protein